jgi:hypothetical protein
MSTMLRLSLSALVCLASLSVCSAMIPKSDADKTSNGVNDASKVADGANKGVENTPKTSDKNNAPASSPATSSGVAPMDTSGSIVSSTAPASTSSYLTLDTSNPSSTKPPISTQQDPDVSSPKWLLSATDKVTKGFSFLKQVVSIGAEKVCKAACSTRKRAKCAVGLVATSAVAVAVVAYYQYANPELASVVICSIGQGLSNVWGWLWAIPESAQFQVCQQAIAFINTTLPVPITDQGQLLKACQALK